VFASPFAVERHCNDGTHSTDQNMSETRSFVSYTSFAFHHRLYNNASIHCEPSTKDICWRDIYITNRMENDVDEDDLLLAP